jgi:putative ABC transport system permease protein
MSQMADPQPREIVGVMRDVRENGPQDEPPAILYLPPGQMPAPLSAMMLPQSLVVRTPGDTAPLATSVPRELRAVDSLQPVTNIRTLEG